MNITIPLEEYLNLACKSSPGNDLIKLAVINEDRAQVIKLLDHQELLTHVEHFEGNLYYLYRIADWRESNQRKIIRQKQAEINRQARLEKEEAEAKAKAELVNKIKAEQESLAKAEQEILNIVELIYKKKPEFRSQYSREVIITLAKKVYNKEANAQALAEKIGYVSRII